VILFVQVYLKGGSSSQVHEEAEDADEREGDDEGEQQEDEEGDEEAEQVEEEGDSESDESSRGFVVTGFVDEGDRNLEVMRQYERELEAHDRALEEDSSDDDYDHDGDDLSEDHVPWD
jgi:hypothetical protein